ncbi:hypothetical protein RCL1_004824 [Eukaryota sp. TZLM3-RCL]
MKVPRVIYFAVTLAICSLTYCLVGGIFMFSDLEPIPYISYSSGRYPILPVFSGAMTVTGCLIALFCSLYVKHFLEATPNLFGSVRSTMLSVAVLCCISSFCLAALSLVSVYDNVVLHTVFAQIFFWTSLVSFTFITVMSCSQHKFLNPGVDIPKTTRFWLKYRIFLLLCLPLVSVPYLLLPAIVDPIKNVWVNSLAALLQYFSVLIVILFLLSLSFELKDYEIRFLLVKKERLTA